eukprot:5179581-Prymnesium_polylepis.2
MLLTRARWCVHPRAAGLALSAGTAGTRERCVACARGRGGCDPAADRDREARGQGPAAAQHRRVAPGWREEGLRDIRKRIACR